MAQDVIWNDRQFKRELRKHVRKQLAKVGRAMIKEMKPRTPKVTGKLRKGFRTRTRTENLNQRNEEIIMSIQQTVWYWHLVEFGTVKTSPKPFVRPVWDSWKQGKVLDEVATGFKP